MNVGPNRMRFLTIAAILTCAVGSSFAGSATADAGARADQLHPFGASAKRPPWFPVYAFSVSCGAVPRRIRLTERAFANGRHIRALDRFRGPTIVMSQQPPPGGIFAVWFQRSDFNQHLLSATVARYGSVQLHVTAVSTDA